MKRLIVCCDGTGNEIGENSSNVLKLYRILRKTDRTTPRQLVSYDPGVGTLARPDPWTKFKQDAVAVFGLATGYGLDESILRAYGFLVEHYEDGDEVFLFGFSRGAYTVRALEGFIHKVGLLAPEQRNLADAALAAYKQTNLQAAGQTGWTVSDDVPVGCDERQALPATRDDQASQFARIVSSRWPTISFLGVWDRRQRHRAAFRPMACLQPRKVILHARESQRESIPPRSGDRRAEKMFRLEPWEERQVFMHNRFSMTNNTEPQDPLLVWFAGVHADIGGGYPEKESGLSKFPLLWMIDEAVKSGLAVNRQRINQLAWGVQRQGSPFTYVAPEVMRDPHQSLTSAWRPLEWLLKRDGSKEWRDRRSRFGYYIPDGKPRAIPEGARTHE